MNSDYVRMNISAYPAYRFESDSASGGAYVPYAAAVDIPALMPDIKLLCHLCRAVITDEAERWAISGAFMHYRINPAGITWQFSCYKSAPGCVVSGVPTEEYTWFAGYHWQIAGCGLCGEHLGWKYTGPEQFYGIINGRLISDQSNK